MSEILKKEKLSINEGKLNREECTKKAFELLKNLGRLAESMQSLVEDEKEVVALFNIGIVISASSCDEADFEMGLGSPEGLQLAIQNLRNVEERIK